MKIEKQVITINTEQISLKFLGNNLDSDGKKVVPTVYSGSDFKVLWLMVFQVQWACSL